MKETGLPEENLKQDPSHQSKDDNLIDSKSVRSSETMDINKPKDHSTSSDVQLKIPSDVQRSNSHHFCDVEHQTPTKSNQNLTEKSVLSDAQRLTISADREHLIRSSSKAIQDNGISESGTAELHCLKVDKDRSVEATDNDFNHSKQNFSDINILDRQSLDKEIQCQLMGNLKPTVTDNHVSRNSLLDTKIVTQMGTQTDDADYATTRSTETNTLDVVDVGVQCLLKTENTVEFGVQCDMYRPPITMTWKHAKTVAGGRINGREDQAYGPSQSSDVCCVS